MKIPISLTIDDPAPILSVYHSQHETGFTDGSGKQGRIIDVLENLFLQNDVHAKLEMMYSLCS